MREEQLCAHNPHYSKWSPKARGTRPQGARNAESRARPGTTGSGSAVLQKPRRSGCTVGSEKQQYEHPSAIKTKKSSLVVYFFKLLTIISVINEASDGWNSLANRNCLNVINL